MREIKFRAWDKAYKAMCYTSEDTKNLSGWLDNPKIFEVMQFTGCHDKNGEEIFEGDIVRNGWGHTSPVTWKKEAVGFRISFPDAPITGIEVIGNIYANPELLDQPKQGKANE